MLRLMRVIPIRDLTEASELQLSEVVRHGITLTSCGQDPTADAPISKPAQRILFWGMLIGLPTADNDLLLFSMESDEKDKVAYPTY